MALRHEVSESTRFFARRQDEDAERSPSFDTDCGARQYRPRHAAPEFVRVDTHVHIHRDVPALLRAMKEASWRGLDIVVCPASGAETFDLEETLRATQKVSRDSGGTLAWASTFDARGFEEPDFADARPHAFVSHSLTERSA